MYNRYIPQPDGTYRRSRVPDPSRHSTNPHQPEPVPPREPEPSCPPPPPSGPPPQPNPAQPCHPGNGAGDFLRQLLPKNLDTGDLLVIVLLLLMAGDCRDDKNTALLTLALYLFL